MSLWLRKALVIFITVATFGLVTPPDYLIVDNTHAKDRDVIDETSEQIKTEESFIIEKSVAKEQEESKEESEEESKQHKQLTWKDVAATVSEEELKETFTEYAVEHAQQQAKTKFGKVIDEEIGTDFDENILPKIEEVIETYAKEWDEDVLRQLALSTRPAGGNGEKILHLYNTETNEDLIRFHVRRDNPPKEGYWFNFHYHDSRDQFLEHYELGKIYWDKNMPPKWMN
ncbi:YpjP family protein [Bacillus solimangrovi]|uniref:YpjP family protein n=1 Tax=Bacillus solimangrovi TaxID=1305675 RepID=UPI000B06ADA7|nr:YpjP family protein [Bacillus solimangrovi]